MRLADGDEWSYSASGCGDEVKSERQSAKAACGRKGGGRPVNKCQRSRGAGAHSALSFRAGYRDRDRAGGTARMLAAIKADIIRFGLKRPD